MHYGVRGQLLLATALHVLQQRVALADDRDVASAQRVGMTELAFQRASAEIHLCGESGGARRAEQPEGSDAQLVALAVQCDEQLG